MLLYDGRLLRPSTRDVAQKNSFFQSRMVREAAASARIFAAKRVWDFASKPIGELLPTLHSPILQPHVNRHLRLKNTKTWQQKKTPMVEEKQPWQPYPMHSLQIP